MLRDDNSRNVPAYRQRVPLLKSRRSRRLEHLVARARCSETCLEMFGAGSTLRSGLASSIALGLKNVAAVLYVGRDGWDGGVWEYRGARHG